MTFPYKIAAFYQFAPMGDISVIQSDLLTAMKASTMRGSILLATEGVNGTIAGPAAAVEGALAEIRRITGLAQLSATFSGAQSQPFRRMKVRLKKEIVTIGNVAANPNEKVGAYVEPQDWNALISSPDVLVIDTRNAYEFGIGTFKGAIDPHTESFGAFPKWVREHLKVRPNQSIAMFCTGGIRCEKASSFMLNEGFENVFHLKGGILNYLEVVKPDESLWQGGCFVFDERVAVGHGLEPTGHTICHGCLRPVSALQRSDEKFEDGVCCPDCADRLTDVQKTSNRERQRQVDLAARRGIKHLGPL